MSVNDASRIIIDDSRVMFLIVASLTDDSVGVIYFRNMFKVQATGPKFTNWSLPAQQLSQLILEQGGID